MSQISKCPKVTVILSYWEASGAVSKLRYKSLLYSTSVGSYCTSVAKNQQSSKKSKDDISARDYSKLVSILYVGLAACSSETKTQQLSKVPVWMPQPLFMQKLCCHGTKYARNFKQGLCYNLS